MSIGTVLNTVLLVAAIMPWVSVSATSFDTNSTVVRDTDGEPLKAGSRYYVLPVFRGRGGGLTLRRRNNTCPLYVAQERSDVLRGLPVIFTPVSGQPSEIHEGDGLNVRTVALPICAQRTTWRLDFSKDSQRLLVATGGTPSTFTLQRYINGYALTFCHVVCNPGCIPICGPLGIYIDADLNRWLASQSDFVFILQLKKA